MKKVRKLKRPVKDKKQHAMACSYLKSYITADSQEIRDNIMYAIIEDYQRGFFDDDFYEVLVWSIETMDKERLKLLHNQLKASKLKSFLDNLFNI